MDEEVAEVVEEGGDGCAEEGCSLEGKEWNGQRWQPYDCVHNRRRRNGVLCAFRQRGECVTEKFSESRCKQAEVAKEQKQRICEMLREIELWRTGRLARTLTAKHRVKGRVLVLRVEGLG